MDRRLLPFGLLGVILLVLIVFGLVRSETARIVTVSEQVGDFVLTLSTDKKVYQEDEFVLVTSHLVYKGRGDVTIKHGEPMVRMITTPRDVKPKGNFRSPSLKKTQQLQSGQLYNPDIGYEFAMKPGEHTLWATAVFEAEGKEQRITVQIPLTIHALPFERKPLQADVLLHK